MRNATASVQLITSAPKYLIEMFGMLLIALLAYLIVAYYADSEGVIPLLGVLALSAQRMLPMLQQIYSGWTAILSGKDSVKDSLDFLDQPVLIQNTYETHDPIKFLDTISLKSLGFRYGVEQPAVLKDLNLKFKRGEIVGIIGTTGSGKSTLLDLIMGLLLPTSGILSVDDVELTYENLNRWQKNIAHVPQTIFLNDATVLSNIAFGVSGQEIDVERVIQAAKLAQIHEDIESWPLGYGTNVGERGVKLSGGQKQRIGIARAFYKKSEVLIFDEATSALDPITESKVMSSFNQLSYRPTVFIIAHRLSTLKQCTRVLKVENGYIIQDGTFQDVVDLKSSLGL
jgi:ATP-binding cassette subfamily B protein